VNIDILCVGTLKEKYLKEATAEYTKRLSAYCNLGIREVKESPLLGSGAAAEATVINAEGDALLEAVNERSYLIALDVQGKTLSSEAFAYKLNTLALEGRSHVSFLIGGSLGISNRVREQAQLRLSFSAMTFPHQLMRVILLEQIYRAFKINRGETYHK
jgi:23S rRNA (pseudouridine1915-N3)-methyltransferase